MHLLAALFDRALAAIPALARGHDDGSARLCALRRLRLSRSRASRIRACRRRCAPASRCCSRWRSRPGVADAHFAATAVRFVIALARRVLARERDRHGGVAGLRRRLCRGPRRRRLRRRQGDRAEPAARRAEWIRARLVARVHRRILSYGGVSIDAAGFAQSFARMPPGSAPDPACVGRLCRKFRYSLRERCGAGCGARRRISSITFSSAERSMDCWGRPSSS